MNDETSTESRTIRKIKPMKLINIILVRFPRLKRIMFNEVATFRSQSSSHLQENDMVFVGR